MFERDIDIPDDVKVEVNNLVVGVKGPKGELNRDFSDPRINKKIKIEKKDKKIIVLSNVENKKMKAMVGTIYSHIRNMINGVLNPYRYVLKIHYSHFPVNVEVKDNKVLIKNFLGEKGARVAEIVGDTKIEVKKDEVVVSSINKEHAGQTAANIEQACRVKKRDRRVFQDGIFIVNKPKPDMTTDMVREHG